MKPFRVACIQNCAGEDTDANLAEVTPMVEAAAAAGASLVCLPEYFARLAPDDASLLAGTPPAAGHPVLQWSAGIAARLGIWLLAGSVAVRLADGRIANRAHLYAADGALVASYDKLHLFDVALANGETYRESASVRPGAAVVLADTPWGGLGLSICYDVRFPHLYRELARRGARFLATPAAFTRTTGSAHWHVLQRARAIETGCYVFAPAQCGRRDWGRETYGHALIVGPWGEVLAEAAESPGFIVADVDPAAVDRARAMVPSLSHDRPLS